MFRRQPHLLDEVMSNLVRIKKERLGTLRDLNAEFIRTDSRGTGQLSRGDFIDCLGRFGFRLSKVRVRDAYS